MGDESTPQSAKAGDVARCFLCGRVLRRELGEPIQAGDDIDLCLGCGALYELPGCC